MKAIKDNKSYTVNTDEEAKTYVSRGYDIQDDNGKIKEYGLGKKISVDDYNTLKKENSKWLFPLAFICGATVEQIGMMCIGWFVLLIINEKISRNKFNKHFLGCIVFSIVGFLTNVFSPGTFTRMTNQGELNEQSFFTVLLAMARKNWLDNISIYIMIILLSVSFCIWAYRFRKKNRFTCTVAGIVMPIFAVLFVLNSLLRFYVTFYGMFLQREIDFGEKTNSIFLILWIIYFALFVFLSLYSAVLIYT